MSDDSDYYSTSATFDDGTLLMDGNMEDFHGTFCNVTNNNCTFDDPLQDRTINISLMVPPEIGKPVYGYLAPIIILTTVLTNSFIVVVLSRPQLRSPTNCILLAISVFESLTGLISLPWFLYYYTFGGYKDETIFGLPAFWCRTFMSFSEILPTIFHTSAIWLTVFLAVQRYVYVKRPSAMDTVHYKRTNISIVAILICSVLMEAPIMFGRYTYPAVSAEDSQKMECKFRMAQWMLTLNPNLVYAAHYWLFAIFVHAGPCCLLVVFSGLLICTLNKTVYRRQQTLGCSGQSGRALRATTKMLIVIIVIFLITEIPAAVIFSLHVLQQTFSIFFQDEDSNDSYRSMNLSLILRNLFILVSYPFKFAIYLSMSQQFRSTVKALFCPKYADAEVVRNHIGHTERLALTPKASIASNYASSGGFSARQKSDALLPTSCNNGYLRDQRAQPNETTDLLELPGPYLYTPNVSARHDTF